MSTANLPSSTALTQSLAAAGRSGFRARIESWFRRADAAEKISRRGIPGGVAESEAGGNRHDDAFEREPSREARDARDSRESRRPRQSRGSFLRPWARRDSGVEDRGNGTGALAELMAGIRESLEKQSARQDELLKYLSCLPEVMHAVRGQMERQGAQQCEVAQILERISRADSEQGRVLDALCRHESAFSAGLSRVGEVMHNVGTTTEAGARALEQLRDSIHSRDGELERAFKSHNARLTTLLSLAIGMSVAAVASAGAVGLLLMHRMH